jgi:hypothetical protein
MTALKKEKMKNVKELNAVIEVMQKRIDGLEDLLKSKVIELEARDLQYIAKIDILTGQIKGCTLGGNDKIENFDCNICNKNFNNRRQVQDHIKKHNKQSFVCTVCDCKFDTRWKLENHLKEHAIKKEFKCEQCDLEFFLKWRLNRHIRGHSENGRKSCHFFNNRKPCPFEENGCKFKHQKSGTCKDLKSCKTYLCQFEHDLVSDKKDNCDSKDFMERTDIPSVNDMTDDEPGKFISFFTSTPKKKKFQCEECLDLSQCTYCFVRQDIQNEHEGGRTNFL